MGIVTGRHGRRFALDLSVLVTPARLRDIKGLHRIQSFVSYRPYSPFISSESSPSITTERSCKSDPLLYIIFRHDSSRGN